MKTSKKLLSGILIVLILMTTVSFTALASETVSIINLAVEKPQAGAAPAATAALTEAATVEVLSMTWSPAESVFKEGTTYTVTIELGIKAGIDAVFADAKQMSVNMNGNKVRRVKTGGRSAVIKFGWKVRSTDSAKTETPKIEKTKSGFYDVKDSEYYADAVCWAVDKNITTGTSSTTFSPEDTCTRAQILTFLWRAVGSPKNGSSAAFNDVNSSDYFSDAAAWAKDKDMVSGSTFDPNIPCTRAYTVIYLWKNAGSPATELSGGFSDVAANSDYAQAVAWAVKNGVTSGTSATTFSPNDTCTRGQIVTFLKRALASTN